MEKISKPSREFFEASGEPEDIEKVKKREEEARQKRVEGKAVQELEILFEEVDFDLLEKIFERIGKKSGINPEEMNFLRKERIGFSLDYFGSYDPEANIITLNTRSVSERARKLDIYWLHFLVYVLCHEESHATAKIVCKGLREFASPFDHYDRERQVGYSQYKGGEWEISEAKPSAEFLFDLFDEGVTEKLGREVFIEYVTSSGFFGRKELETFFAKGDELKMPYAVPYKFVEALITRMSHETGIDQDIVWQAIIRGQREGENLMRQDLQEFFSEMISPDFLSRLALIKSDEEFEDLLQELKVQGASEGDSPYPHDEVGKKFFAWLKDTINELPPKS